MIYLLLVILMVLASILMCFIVLIQNSKGGGLASSFSSSNAVLGVRKTTDFLEKTTWTLAAIMVVFSIAAAYSVRTGTAKTDVILEQAQQGSSTAPYTIPTSTATPATELPTTPTTETPAAEPAGGE